IDACLLLLERPGASTVDLMARAPGPDFPTGGVIVEPVESLREAYETGRGGVRLRARWTKEDLGRGLWRIVVSEIPYQVRKADLIEQLASLVESKRAPLLGDVRDESAEDVRLVLEPRARTVEPEVLMESLFKLSDLETRFPININVLNASGAPQVMGLKTALRAFLDHRREVLARRARFRLAKIEQRLHLVEGLLIVFLDLDEVIRIVRFEEQPKMRLIERFEISEVQAEAILNTRLRQLASLEELELRREHQELCQERDSIQGLLGSEKEQWKLVGVGLRGMRKLLGPATAVGARRSTFEIPPTIDHASAFEAFVAREPVTVILSERGWIRAVRGRVEDPTALVFKEGDRLAFAVPAETTDKLLVFASDGRFFTLACDKLPSGRGHGEPLRLLVDLDDRVAILAVFVHKPGARRLVASKAGYGFVVPVDEAVAFRKAGKQVMSVGEDGAAVCLAVEGDTVAVVGENGKALIFPLADLPEMARGKGVKLQSYRQGGLRDARIFAAEEGLGWTDAAGRVRAWSDWRLWKGRRASAGRLTPRGFPASRRFRP
ncbi:MAG TPA: DNA gyrase subunit A, partial [Caulobacteraceae bacterium]